MAGQLITLLTDFGTRDGYAAAMKGVVLQLCPRATIIDAGQDVSRYDAAAGAWALAQYAFLYPPGTIHIAVVDPGVGTDRHALIGLGGGQIFVAPDNGLLHWVRQNGPGFEARVIRSGIHRPEGVSNTFHGRDLFAHVAGRLAGGDDRIEDVSDPATEIVIPPWGQVRSEGDLLIGEVVHVDHYGNVITSFRAHHIKRAGWNGFVVCVGGSRIHSLLRTYGEAPPGQPIALIGSHDHVELAIRQDSAAQRMGLKRGDSVSIEPADG